MAHATGLRQGHGLLLLPLLSVACSIYGEDLLCGSDCSGSGEGDGDGEGVQAGGSSSGGDAGSGGGGGMSGGAPSVGGAGGTGGTVEVGGMAGQGSGGSTGICSEFPIPSRSGWFAQASRAAEGESAAQAVDASLSTRWATGEPMNSSDYWMVDFGVRVALTRVELYHTVGDQARGYEIVVSDEFPTLSTPPLLSGESESPELVEVEFEQPIVGRYFFIQQTGSDEFQWWSLREVFFSCAD